MATSVMNCVNESAFVGLFPYHVYVHNQRQLARSATQPVGISYPATNPHAICWGIVRVFLLLYLGGSSALASMTL